MIYGWTLSAVLSRRRWATRIPTLKRRSPPAAAIVFPTGSISGRYCRYNGRADFSVKKNSGKKTVAQKPSKILSTVRREPFVAVNNAGIYIYMCTYAYGVFRSGWTHVVWYTDRKIRGFFGVIKWRIIHAAAFVAETSRVVMAFFPFPLITDFRRPVHAQITVRRFCSIIRTPA